MVVPDRQRDRFVSWDLLMNDRDVRLGVVSPDLMAPARRQLPACEIVPIESISQFFEGQVTDIDGLIIAAEEGAAWNVLYPAYTVVMPEPIIRRQVGIAARQGDASWLRFLDRWLEFERSDGSLDRLRAFWIEGGRHARATSALVCDPRRAALDTVIGAAARGLLSPADRVAPLPLASDDSVFEAFVPPLALTGVSGTMADDLASPAESTAGGPHAAIPPGTRHVSHARRSSSPLCRLGIPAPLASRQGR